MSRPGHDFCTSCGRPFTREDVAEMDTLGPAASPEEMRDRSKRAEAAVKYLLTNLAQRGVALAFDDAGKFVHDAPLPPRGETLVEREERLASIGALAPLLAAVVQYASDIGWHRPEVRHQQNLLIIELTNKLGKIAELLGRFDQQGADMLHLVGQARKIAESAS